MIENTVRKYLLEKLSPIPVYMEKPESKPAKYVLIEKTGSGIENHIKSATLAIQSIAGRLIEAGELNEQVNYAMEQIITLPNISRAKLDTDYNFTNTATKEYRYQAVYDLTYYE